MRRVLRAGAELEHRKNLGARIDGQPQPEHVLRAAQPASQFIQLEVREPEMAEAVLMQDLCMFPCTSQPRRDGGMSKAEDPPSFGWVQPFGQCMTSSPRTLCVYATACPSKQAAEAVFPS
jgi:hypothetical protein